MNLILGNEEEGSCTPVCSSSMWYSQLCVKEGLLHSWFIIAQSISCVYGYKTTSFLSVWENLNLRHICSNHLQTAWHILIRSLVWSQTAKYCVLCVDGTVSFQRAMLLVLRIPLCSLLLQWWSVREGDFSGCATQYCIYLEHPLKTVMKIKMRWDCSRRKQKTTLGNFVPSEC